ncbi:MAG: DUF3861 domain-containing protein [Rikenellaceae bacterium]|nr:DUF3861 domain-containing protein [Rikenellaceae bacterium]
MTHSSLVALIKPDNCIFYRIGKGRVNHKINQKSFQFTFRGPISQKLNIACHTAPETDSDRNRVYSGPNGGAGKDGAVGKSLGLDFENHDDIFRIVALQQEQGLFGDAEQAARFIVGLKLFSAVMMENRDAELFRGFEPAFRDMMKRLKGGRPPVEKE